MNRRQTTSIILWAIWYLWWGFFPFILQWVGISKGFVDSGWLIPALTFNFAIQGGALAYRIWLITTK